jgi:hypothetical protein
MVVLLEWCMAIGCERIEMAKTANSRDRSGKT